MKIINKVFIFLIRGLRPLLGPASCCYILGCTQFAIIQLKTKSLFSAMWEIIKRILSCNPFYLKLDGIKKLVFFINVGFLFINTMPMQNDLTLIKVKKKSLVNPVSKERMLVQGVVRLSESSHTIRGCENVKPIGLLSTFDTNKVETLLVKTAKLSHKKLGITEIKLGFINNKKLKIKLCYHHKPTIDTLLFFLKSNFENEGIDKNIAELIDIFASSHHCSINFDGKKIDYDPCKTNVIDIPQKGGLINITLGTINEDKDFLIKKRDNLVVEDIIRLNNSKECFYLITGIYADEMYDFKKIHIDENFIFVNGKEYDQERVPWEDEDWIRKNIIDDFEVNDKKNRISSLFKNNKKKLLTISIILFSILGLKFLINRSF